MSAQPEHYPMEPEVSEADLDAIDVMWMERLARPWAPTPEVPFRPTRCSAPVRNGERAGRRCGRTATLGTTVCEAHGAQLPVVKAAAAEFVGQQRLKLVNASGEMVDGLLELARSSTSDAVRLKAMTECLDRAGLRGGTELDVSVTDNTDPATLLRERMEQLKRRTIDAEVVRPSLEPPRDDTVHDDSPSPHEEHTDG